MSFLGLGITLLSQYSTSPPTTYIMDERVVMLNEVKHLAGGWKAGTEFGGANPFQARSFAIAQDDKTGHVASFPTPAALRPSDSG